MKVRIHTTHEKHYMGSRYLGTQTRHLATSLDGDHLISRSDMRLSMYKAHLRSQGHEIAAHETSQTYRNHNTKTQQS